jgi:hypothetical protein
MMMDHVRIVIVHVMHIAAMMMVVMRLSSPGTIPVAVIITVIVPVIVAVGIPVIVVRPAPAPIPSYVNMNTGIIIDPVIFRIIAGAVVISLRNGSDVLCGILALSIVVAPVIINIIIIAHLLRGFAALNGQA